MRHPTDPHLHNWSKPNLFSNTLLCLDFSQYAIIFLQSFVNADFFPSGIDPDILINVLEDCIILLTWAAWVLFNFHLKQKQKFSVWSFTRCFCFIRKLFFCLRLNFLNITLEIRLIFS